MFCLNTFSYEANSATTSTKKLSKKKRTKEENQKKELLDLIVGNVRKVFVEEKKFIEDFELEHFTRGLLSCLQDDFSYEIIKEKSCDKDWLFSQSLRILKEKKEAKKDIIDKAYNNTVENLYIALEILKFQEVQLTLGLCVFGYLFYS